MGPKINKIVMSKTVAAAYLTRVSEASRTVTVFFSDASHQSKFKGKLKESFGDTVNVTEGYDFLILIMRDKGVFDKVCRISESMGLDYTDI